MRRLLREENILLACLVLVALGAAGAFELRGRWGDCVLAAGVGLGAGAAKLAFDSMVQRDVHETTRGRAFAGFETRFQLAWVIGALIPVVITLPEGVGALVVALATTGAGMFYVTARGSVGRRDVTSVG